MVEDIKFTVTRAAVKAQIDKIRRAYTALGDELNALDALLEGQKTAGQIANDMVRDFCGAWGARYRGRAYVPNWKQDAPAMKRLINLLGAVEVRTRIGRYLASRDPFYVNALHPLAMFVAAVNKFAAADGELTLEAAPVDCQHQPTCRSDAAHTARLTRERRENG